MCRRYVARVLIVSNKPCIVALRDVAAPCHERRGATAQRNQLLSYIPFHYIKRAGFKKVAVIIKLFLVDRAKKRSEDRLNAALNGIAFAFHKSIADRVGVRRFGITIRVKKCLDTIGVS